MGSDLELERCYLPVLQTRFYFLSLQGTFATMLRTVYKLPPSSAGGAMNTFVMPLRTVIFSYAALISVFSI